MRDITLGETFSTKFTTAAPDTGAPTTLSGTPVVSAYVGNSTTQITAGITLTVDFDSVTGLNDVTVVATSGNGYTDNTDVALVITTGTVDGNSAVGYVVERFTIGRSAAYTRLGAPAGASVSADIADVEGKVDDLETRLGTPSDLGSGATVAANLADIEGQTDDIGAAGVGLTAITQHIDTEIAAIKAVTDALPDSGALTSLATAAALTTVDSNVDAIKAVTDNLPDSGALTSLATAAALDAVDNFVDTEVAAIKAKTDQLTFGVANTLNANITHINETEVTGDGGTGTEWGPAS